MKVSQAIQSFREYHRLNSKKNTLKNYEFIFTRFQEAFGDRQAESITTDEVLSFLTGFSTAAKPATKRHRYSCLKAFFNFLKNSVYHCVFRSANDVSLATTAGGVVTVTLLRTDFD